MSRVLITFLSALSFCAVAVSEECNSLTQQRIQECTLHSHILDTYNSPKTEYQLKRFCEHEAHNIINCINGHVQECIHNQKERKIIDLLVDIRGMKRGFDHFCANVSVLIDDYMCLDELKKPEFAQCVRSDIYSLKRSLMGISDMKLRLDRLCRFFDTFRGCFVHPFRGNCRPVGNLYSNFMLSIKYPYCKLNDQERRARILEYNQTPAYAIAVDDPVPKNKPAVDDPVPKYKPSYHNSGSVATITTTTSVLFAIAGFTVL